GDRAEENRDLRRPGARRARRRRLARRVRGAVACGADGARGPEPAALSVGAGPSAREVEASGSCRAGATGLEAREAAPRRAGRAGQAGGGPRQRRRGGAEGRRGHAPAGRCMSVLLFVEPGDDLSLQALTFARSLGEVKAVSVEGSYAPAAWAAGIAAAAGDAEAI